MTSKRNDWNGPLTTADHCITSMWLDQRFDGFSSSNPHVRCRICGDTRLWSSGHIPVVKWDVRSTAVSE